MLRLNQSKKINPLDESGFTLLEIIAVLVILSIMAVVAIPKYFDLQEEARSQTIKVAMAEAIGRINGHFAKEILGGKAPSEIVYQVGDGDGQLGADLGDFSWTIKATGAGDYSTSSLTDIDAVTAIEVDSSTNYYKTTPKQLLITVSAKQGTALDGERYARPIDIPGL